MTGFPFEETHRDPFCYVGVTVFRISVLVPKTCPRYLARAKQARIYSKCASFNKGHELLGGEGAGGVGGGGAGGRKMRTIFLIPFSTHCPDPILKRHSRKVALGGGSADASGGTNSKGVTNLQF